MRIVLVRKENTLDDDRMADDIQKEVEGRRKNRKSPSELKEYFRPKINIWEL